MDPVSAIATAVGKSVESIFTFLTVSKDAKYGRLPEWLSPADFQNRSKTADILLIGMFVVIIFTIIGLTVAARRKQNIMALDDLEILQIIGRVRGAYVDEPGYQFQGETGFTGLQEILQYIFDNLGGEGGNDRYLESAALDGTVLTLTLNDASEVTVDLASINTDTNDYVTGAALAGNILTLTRLGGGTVQVDLSALGGGGGGGGLLQYEATAVNDPVDDGCFVTTDTAGATYERTGGAGQNTEGILTLPSGSIPRGVSIHFSAAQAPGNTFFLNVDYSETSKDVNGAQNSVMPPLATVTSKPGAFSDASPATNYVHSGTPLQVGIAQVDDNGSRVRVRYKITNYNQQVGANASILTFIFP